MNSTWGKFPNNDWQKYSIIIHKCHTPQYILYTKWKVTTHDAKGWVIVIITLFTICIAKWKEYEYEVFVWL